MSLELLAITLHSHVTPTNSLLGQMSGRVLESFSLDSVVFTTKAMITILRCGTLVDDMLLLSCG